MEPSNVICLTNKSLGVDRRDLSFTPRAAEQVPKQGTTYTYHTNPDPAWRSSHQSRLAPIVTFSENRRQIKPNFIRARIETHEVCMSEIHSPLRIGIRIFKFGILISFYVYMPGRESPNEDIFRLIRYSAVCSIFRELPLLPLPGWAHVKAA